jgi:hypothetical protein
MLMCDSVNALHSYYCSTPTEGAEADKGACDSPHKKFRNCSCESQPHLPYFQKQMNSRLSDWGLPYCSVFCYLHIYVSHLVLNRVVIQRDCSFCPLSVRALKINSGLFAE